MDVIPAHANKCSYVCMFSDFVSFLAERASHSQVCSIENRDIVRMSFLPFDKEGGA